MLQCDQSNQMKPYSEQCSPGGTVYYAIQGGSTFESVDEKGCTTVGSFK